MRRVKFGDVIKEVKNKIDRDNNPYEYYIAGGHMDTEDLTIRRRGSFATDDVGPAFIREFKEGQILYGSRRTYLKKVAVADFDGVTANTTFVIETKDNTVLLHELIPFIMLSERFTQWSIMNSKGSTNPYILFSDLCDYEIALPDMEKQRELSNLLWAMDKCKNAYMNMLQKADELVKSQFIELFGNPITNDKDWPTMKMKKVAPAMPYEGDIPLEKGCQWLLNLDMVESNTGRIIQKNMVHPEDIGNSTTKFGVENVLYSKLRPYLNKVVIPEEYGFVTTEMIPLRPDKKYLTSMFISMLLRGDAFVNFINSKVAGTKMPRVSMNVFWNIDVILPPMLLQEQFAAFVHQSDKSKFVLHTKELKIKRVITNGGKL